MWCLAFADVLILLCNYISMIWSYSLETFGLMMVLYSWEYPCLWISHYQHDSVWCFHDVHWKIWKNWPMLSFVFLGWDFKRLLYLLEFLLKLGLHSGSCCSDLKLSLHISYYLSFSLQWSQNPGTDDSNLLYWITETVTSGCLFDLNFNFFFSSFDGSSLHSLVVVV